MQHFGLSVMGWRGCAAEGRFFVFRGLGGVPVGSERGFRCGGALSEIDSFGREIAPLANLTGVAGRWRQPMKRLQKRYILGFDQLWHPMGRRPPVRRKQYAGVVSKAKARASVGSG